MKKLNVIVFVLIVFLSSALFGQTEIKTVAKDTIQLAYNKIEKQRLVGAVDVITGDELLHSNEYSANMILPGLASGLYASKSGTGPGYNWSTLKVRGLSRGNSSDGPLIVVDGIPNRTLNDLTVESIETITVLKDVTAKMLYGSVAANGVILVNTRRGKNEKLNVTFSAEAGIKQPTFEPEYLDAATYAEKYNQALLNDGLDPFYTQAEIDAYKNGNDKLNYPNNDYMSTFLKSFTDYERVNTILTGGDEKTRFFLNLEYLHEGGMEAVRDARNFHQLNLVSNLDYQVNEIISASLDMSTRMGMQQNSTVGDNTLYNKIATQRPNDYPFFVTDDYSVDTDLLGYNTKGTGNLYGDITRGGYNSGQEFKAQTTFGLDFDFNQYIEGLSAKAALGFDSYNSIYKGKSLGYASFRVLDGDTLLRIGDDEIKSSEQKFSDDFYRNVAGYGNITYDRSFGEHSIKSVLNFSMRQLAYKTLMSGSSVKQDLKGVNVGLDINYAYANKYILQLNGSYMGSDKFERENRFKPYGAIGAAWVLSEEDFLSDVDAINYLKLKASFGRMGYDNAIDYYTYRNEYGGGGAYYFGYQNSATDYANRITQYGNANITFEEATELNVGIESQLLNNRLTLDANYFNEVRTGMPVVAWSSMPSYVWGAAANVNYNSVRNTGIDLGLKLADKVNDFSYAIGANLIYSKSVYEAYDQIVIYEHQRREGTVTDGYWGYVAEGLYASQDEIDADGVTSAYGDIIPGDIKYTDITNDLGDNVINEYDTQEIGNWFPRINYGVNINLEYKGFGLYLLGQGITQVDRMMNNIYFWNYGNRKYTAEVMKDHYPRLTSNTSGGHSYKSSTYWMENGSYFKLRTAEISYALPKDWCQQIGAQKLKFFARGTDLLTLSSIKTVDPEDTGAGISKYPLFTTVTFGAKITF